LSIEVNLCSERSDCRSQEEIEDIMKTLTLRSIVFNKNYKPNNIQEFLFDDIYFESIQLEYPKNRIWKVLKNELELCDNYLDFGGLLCHEAEFYTVGKSLEIDIVLRSKSYFNLIISLDTDILTHERKVTTVFDFFGDIGGLYSTLYFFA
jgi:hypothetical protein